MEEILKSSRIDWNQLKTSLDEKYIQEQDSKPYLNVCRLLLQRLSQDFFADDVEEEVFDDIFLHGNHDVLSLVSEYFYMEKKPSFKRDKLLSLLHRMIYDNDHLLDLFLNECEISRRVSEQVPNTIISMPERVANIMEVNVPQYFVPSNFFKQVTKVIFLCLKSIHAKIQQQSDVNLEFISQLTGRIGFNGHSEVLWVNILKPLIVHSENDYLWQKIGYRLLIKTQKDMYLETILQPLLNHANNPNTIKKLLLNSINENLKVAFLITNKFLMVHHFEEDKIIHNIIDYLASTSQEKFIKALKDILNVWSNASALRYRSYQQHFYLSRILMVMGMSIKKHKIQLTNDKISLSKTMMHEIETHLKNSQTELRNMGMVVGEIFMDLLESSAPKLKFEYEMTPDIERLKLLSNTEAINIEPHYEPNEEVEVMEDEEKKSFESDDEDLKPFDMSKDIPASKYRKPFYIRDTMKGLTEQEKPEWTQLCLETIESLIISSGSQAIHEISTELAKILFNMDDNYNIPNFIGLRIRSLIALCVSDPKNVANYLTSIFYDKNYTIRNRLDILEVLVCASQELSGPANKIKDEKLNLASLSLVPKEVTIAEEHWKKVVENRILAKTRIISQKPKARETFVNRFSPVAGYFFFPLVSNSLGPEITLDFSGEDHYVLGRLIYSLGIMQHSASLSMNSKNMAKALLEFLWYFRFHCEAFVRQAIIFCFCMILSSVPPIYLLRDLCDQIFEFQGWLVEVTEHDADRECIERSFKALIMLQDLKEEHKSVQIK